MAVEADNWSARVAEANNWLAAMRAEWGGRCMPGKIHMDVSLLLTARFSCYSIFVDGIPALLGALGVAMSSYVLLAVVRWITIGFVQHR